MKVYCLFYSEGYSERLVAIFTDPEIACGAAKKNGWYGGDLDVKSVDVDPRAFDTPCGKVTVS